MASSSSRSSGTLSTAEAIQRAEQAVANLMAANELRSVDNNLQEFFDHSTSTLQGPSSSSPALAISMPWSLTTNDIESLMATGDHDFWFNRATVDASESYRAASLSRHGSSSSMSIFADVDDDNGYRASLQPAPLFSSPPLPSYSALELQPQNQGLLQLQQNHTSEEAMNQLYRHLRTSNDTNNDNANDNDSNDDLAGIVTFPDFQDAQDRMLMELDNNHNDNEIINDLNNNDVDEVDDELYDEDEEEEGINEEDEVDPLPPYSRWDPLPHNHTGIDTNDDDSYAYATMMMATATAATARRGETRNNTSRDTSITRQQRISLAEGLQGGGGSLAPAAPAPPPPPLAMQMAPFMQRLQARDITPPPEYQELLPLPPPHQEQQQQRQTEYLGIPTAPYSVSPNPYRVYINNDNNQHPQQQPQPQEPQQPLNQHQQPPLPHLAHHQRQPQPQPQPQSSWRTSWRNLLREKKAASTTGSNGNNGTRPARPSVYAHAAGTGSVVNSNNGVGVGDMTDNNSVNVTTREGHRGRYWSFSQFPKRLCMLNRMADWANKTRRWKREHRGAASSANGETPSRVDRATNHPETATTYIKTLEEEFRERMSLSFGRNTNSARHRS